jgi:two-component system, NarL family, response regulator DegU
MKKLTIYVADDHTFVRKGMIRLLNTFDRVSIVKEAINGRELIQLVSQTQPDAVVLDLEMPIMSGIEAAKHLTEHYPNVKIVVLTMHTEEYFILSLMEIGVHGFLSKSAEPGEVEKAIYAVVDKDFYRNEIVNKTLLNGIKKSYSGSSKLSPREVEILLLICRELSPSEISERLMISEKTFFNHRAHILTKIEGRGNVSIVKYAYQNGLIELSQTV